jgi:Calpain family cysteine protease
MEKAYTGAVNPFALVEVLMKRKVDWNRVSDPVEFVARKLDTPAKKLFDGGEASPIILDKKTTRPFVDMLPEEAKSPKAAGPKADQIEAPDPQRKKSAKPNVALDIHSRLSPALRNRLAEILIPLPRLEETEYPGAHWVDIGDFFEEGTEFADPVQGALGDCWLIAALSSVAWSRPYAVIQKNRATGSTQEQFVDRIDIGNLGSIASYELTERLPVTDTGHFPLYGRSSESGEIWPGMYEKAFAKLRTGNLTDKPDFRALNGGDPVDASARLVPGLTAHYTGNSSTSANNLWSLLLSNSIANPVSSGPIDFLIGRSGRTVNPMTAWTYGKASDAPDSIAYDNETRIVGCHAYSVLGWMSSTRRILSRLSDRYIILRNPWGMYEGLVDVATGSWDAFDRSWMRSTPLNAGGVFAMKIESFKKYFAGIGVAS